MSRLTKRKRDGRAVLDMDALDFSNAKYLDDIIYKLAHYEDLEEDGRLIELPCKVDELVWVVKNEEVEPHWVGSFYVTELDGFLCVTVNLTDIEERDLEVSLEDFGKTVILAKNGAEAEARLAELKGGAE